MRGWLDCKLVSQPAPGAASVCVLEYISQGGDSITGAVLLLSRTAVRSGEPRWDPFSAPKFQDVHGTWLGWPQSGLVSRSLHALRCIAYSSGVACLDHPQGQNQAT